MADEKPKYVGIYTIRHRYVTVNGHRSGEYQVVHGRKVIGRHDTEDQAMRQAVKLTEAKAERERRS